MSERVSVVPWGNIEDPDAPRQYGLKVGKAYVCRGPEVVLFDSRGEAVREAAALRARLADVAA
ncbi:hypothetical protein [Caulobacter segnis]